MIKKLYVIYIPLLSACLWMLTLLPQLETAQARENNKPLDTKQIEHLEHQLSEVRQRIDQLRHVDNPRSSQVIEYLTKRSPKKVVVLAFAGGLFFVKLMHKDDFRVSDRVLTVRRINGVKQITGYGAVIRLEGDEALFEVLAKSATCVEDEVYVINREDTSVGLVYALQP